MPFIRILFVGLRSIDHYSFWNMLSLDALEGHLLGVYGDSILIDRIECDTIDCFVENYASDVEYDIIGISVSTNTIELCLNIVKTLNLLDTGILLLGGQLPTYLPQEILNRINSLNCLDIGKVFCVGGEAERVIELIVGCLNKSVQNLHTIRKIDGVVSFSEDNGCGRISKLPVNTPKLQKLPYLPKYTPKEVDGIKVVQAQLSRGCSWGKCSFCTRYSFRNRGWESFSIDRIERDINHLICDLGVDVIEFCDDDFFGKYCSQNLDRANKIRRFIHEARRRSKREVQFRIFVRPGFIVGNGDFNHVETIKGLLNDYRSVGLKRLYIGIESGVDSQLQRYNRGYTAEQAEVAIKILKEISMSFDCGYIAFDPLVTIGELEENVRFYEKNGLIESNQWFWRSVAINVGTAMSRCPVIMSLLGDLDCNTMAYKYKFKDPLVQGIVDMLYAFTSDSRSKFYKLKSISKLRYTYDNGCLETIAKHSVQSNGIVVLRLVKSILVSIQQAKMREKEILAEMEKALSGGGCDI